ncbi:MAG: transposase [Mesorhizobium sp.]|nr:MAG: transposase [Mesorhizobium sp.]
MRTSIRSLLRSGAVFPINGRLRDQLLDETSFTSLAHARAAIALGRVDYNTARPHSQIAWQTPAEFAITFNPRRSLALRYAKGSAPATVASPAQQGTTQAGNELKTG